MASVIGTSRGTTRSPAWGARVVGASLLAFAVALGAGRFAGLGPTAGDQGTAPTSPSDRTALEQRVATDPDDGAAWQALAALAIADASGSGDRSKVELAQHAVDESVRLRPDDLTSYRLQGLLDLTLHRFADAYETGTAAHAAHPASPDALAILVDASIELGRYEEAERHLGALLDRRPDAAALARVSYLREITGDVEGARLVMDQAETAAAGSDAEAATIAVLVGDLALADGQAAAALAAYDRADRRAEPSSLSVVGRARALVALGHDGEAMQLLTDEAAARPEPAIWTLLGDVQTAQGLHEQASATYASSRELIGRHGASGEDNTLEAAEFEADHGDPAEAVRIAERAYAIRQTIFTADALGWALTRSGRPQDALAFVHEAVRFGTASVSVHLHAAVAMDAVGDREGARQQLAIAFSRSPWPAFARRPEAVELANRLAVAAPPAWQP